MRTTGQVLGNETMMGMITKYQEGWPGSLLELVQSCQAFRVRFCEEFEPYQVMRGKEVVISQRDLCLKDPKGRPFIFHMAIVHGDDQKARQIAQLFPEVMTSMAVQCAARHGRAEILNMLIQGGCSCSVTCLNRAAKYGHLDASRVMIEIGGVECTSKTIKIAAENGHLEIVKYFHSLCPDLVCYGIIDAAVTRGELDEIKFLLGLPNFHGSINTFRYAVQAGRLDILEYLEEHIPFFERIWAGDAARYNHEHIIDHYLETATLEYFDDTVTKEACQHGNLNIAKKLFPWLGAPADTLATMDFDENKEDEYLEIVDSLLRLGYEGSLKTIENAAKAGYFGVVQLLYESGLQENISVILSIAARIGNLDLVKFAHSHCKEGCVTEAMKYAASRGDLEILQFLHDNRPDGWTTHVMDLAARNGHYDIVQFLHTHRQEGCTTDAMDFAAKYGHYDIVQFLHTQRLEGCTKNAMDEAALHGHLEIVKFLHEYRQEGCTTKALDGAATR